MTGKSSALFLSEYIKDEVVAGPLTQTEVNKFRETSPRLG